MLRQAQHDKVQETLQLANKLMRNNQYGLLKKFINYGFYSKHMTGKLLCRSRIIQRSTRHGIIKKQVA